MKMYLLLFNDGSIYMTDESSKKINGLMKSYDQLVFDMFKKNDIYTIITNNLNALKFKFYKQDDYYVLQYNNIEKIVNDYDVLGFDAQSFIDDISKDKKIKLLHNLVKSQEIQSVYIY